MTELPTYELKRTFNAPAALVWETWTKPEHLSHWNGPGVDTVIHGLDVRPGGAWLVEMRSPQWSSFQRADYTEVEAPHRLVFLMSMTDAEWNIAPNPQMPDWPRVLRSEVQLAEEGGKTRMTFTWTPENATEAEIACFAGAMDGLGKGWGAGMDMLEALLADLQAAA